MPDTRPAPQGPHADSVVLYDYARSSACYRVRIALNLAGITYAVAPVDLLAGQQTQPDHMARNPQGLVPVLDIDGQRLTQSLAIIDYLDQTRGLGLLPSAPAPRAMAQALAHAIAVDLHPVCNLRVAQHAAEIAPIGDMPKDWMRHFLHPGLRAFEALLAGFEQAPFCTGAAPGLADLCLIPQIYNARRWNVDLSDLPRLRRIETACADHPAFAAAHPDSCIRA